MKNERKYSLKLAISMVIGTVIGSGVFFKSDEVLSKSGGDYQTAILAWLFGGSVMLFGALVIGNYATKVNVANGLVDYFEYTFGKINQKLGDFSGYIIGWYLSILYYPALLAVVSWVAAQYSALILNVDNPSNSPTTWFLTLFYAFLIYLVATCSRLISSYIQISTTIIKLIPLLLIAIAAIIFSINNPVDLNAATTTMTSSSFSGAVIETAFIFDGWILVTAINDELKNPKRDLPRALFLGSLVIIAIYILYFTGIVALAGADAVISDGDLAVNTVANSLFGTYGGTILTIFIILSCLGTVNGLVMASSRVSYQIALRNHGLMPKQMRKINKVTKTALASAIFSFILALFMVFIWYANHNQLFSLSPTVANILNAFPGAKYIAGPLFIDISSLPIVLNYIALSILYVAAIIQFKEDKLVKRYIFPVLALIGSSIIVYGGFIDPAISLYLIISFIIIGIGIFFYRHHH